MKSTIVSFFSSARRISALFFTESLCNCRNAAMRNAI